MDIVTLRQARWIDTQNMPGEPHLGVEPDGERRRIWLRGIEADIPIRITCFLDADLDLIGEAAPKAQSKGAVCSGRHVFHEI